MAAQDAAENATLREPIPDKAENAGKRFQKIRSAYLAGRLLARLALFDRRADVQAVVALVTREEFCRAIQVPSELTALGEILEVLRPEAAMEIGTFKGGTLLFLTRLASPRAIIISVDLFGGAFGGGYSGWRAWLYRRFAHGSQRIYTLRGDSHSYELVVKVKDALRGRPLDYLFIDGDHSYEGVKQDFALYAPLVRKGGIIAFHDIVAGPAENVGGVPQFWSGVKGKYRHAEFVRDPNQGGYGIGVLYVD